MKISSRDKIALISLVILLLFGIYMRRYQEETLDFYNSDAPYHIVLTMMGYRESPMTEHFFLPIVTLGTEEDKYIPWGAGVADSAGRNTYYTSFGTMAFFVPYVFLTIFGMSYSVDSLYIFNSILYLLTFWLSYRLLVDLFSAYFSKVHLLFLATFYAFSPEILHGMGLCYWAHSLSQVAILGQILCYHRLRESEKGSKSHKIYAYGFLIICVVFPYLEWTGYVANGICALLVAFDPKISFFSGEKEKKWISKVKGIQVHWGNFFLLCVLTVFALFLFALHYQLVIDVPAALGHVYERFTGRNATSGKPLSYLWMDYFYSFPQLVALNGAFLLLVLCFSKAREVLWALMKKYAYVLLYFLVILVENLIMLGHAITYSFDRMKLVFLLLTCFVILLISLKESDLLPSFGKLPLLCLLSGVVGLFYYETAVVYTWDIDYGRENQVLVQELQGFLPVEEDYLLFQTEKARGYSSFIFQKGLYDVNYTVEEMLEICREKEVSFAVKLYTNRGDWNKHEYTGFQVFQVETGEIIHDYGIGFPLEDGN